jgi:hypothetical protein
MYTSQSSERIVDTQQCCNDSNKCKICHRHQSLATITIIADTATPGLLLLSCNLNSLYLFYRGKVGQVEKYNIRIAPGYDVHEF